MGNLTDAYNYVIAACNCSTLRYSQAQRKTIDIMSTNITYCDCSSLMSKALTVGDYFKNNPWFTTSNEQSYLVKAGWTRFNSKTQWQAGDILWRSGHTEMVYSSLTSTAGKGYTMGAHTARYSAQNQVSISSDISTGSAWTYLFRDTSQSVTTHKWHQSNTYLTIGGANNLDNCYMVYSFFYDLGFTNESIAGIIGNLQKESHTNPGVYQNLDDTSSTNGYGLAQFTPNTKWFNYASSHNIDVSDADENGDGQLEYINQGETLGEWITTTSYPYSWAQFSQITNVEEATKAFEYEYERAGTVDMSERIQYANDIYDIIISGAWGANSATGGSDTGKPSGRADYMRRGGAADLMRRLVIRGRF